MGKPAYLLTNLITPSALTGGNIDSHFPLDNLVDGILGKTTRWTGGGGNANAHMESSPQVSFDTLFIGNHNLVSPEFFEITGNPGLIVTTTHYSFARDHDIFIDLAGISGFTQNAHYISVNFGASHAIEVGEMVIGKRISFPRSPMWGVGKRQVNTGISMETEGGIQSDYELSKYSMIEPTFRFPESEYATFQAFSDAVGRTPFVYIPDVSQTVGYYVRKQRGFEPDPVGPGMDGSSMAHWYDWKLSMRTESPGLSITA
jgi:hypothetical protein